VPLLIPEPIWREWKMNGVDPEALAEFQAEHGEAAVAAFARRIAGSLAGGCAARLHFIR
jgi:hypothetical protein